MKKHASVLAAGAFALGLLGLATLPASAFDWGGTLDNATRYTYSGGSLFYQEDKLALWMQAGLGAGLRLTAQGSYTFTIERPYLFDLDLLTLGGEYVIGSERQSVLGFTLGRFRASEFSRLVLDDNVDGIRGFWRAAALNASVLVGYTGLQLAPVSTIDMSWADLNSSSLLAPPRLIELASLEFPELVGRQDLMVSLVLQQDLRSQDELLQPGPSLEISGSGGSLHTEYLGVALRGPLPASLYYDLFAYLGTGRTLSYLAGEYSYEWMVSGLFGGGLRWFREDWLGSRAGLRFLLATGDEDAATFVEGNREGLATQFVPMSEAELALVFSPELGNLGLLELSYSLKPLTVLQTYLKGYLFFRPVDAPVSDPRVDPAADSSFLGTEFDLVAHYRPFSDLGLALSTGVFVPGTAFKEAYREAQFRALLEISFSF